MNFNRKGKAPDNSIAMFATHDGIRTVGSPVRMKILAMLKEQEMGFDSIVDASGKAKSTVSVHLQSLVKDGIVSSKPDAEDARKKVFFIDSSYLGGLSRCDRLEADMHEYMAKYSAKATDQFEFFRLMFRTIRVALLNEGIDIDPVLHEAGRNVGNGVYSQMADDDLELMLGKIGDFWESHKLGRIKVKSLDPLVLYVYDCFECQDLPFLGRPACAFDSGMLKSIFSSHFGDERDVAETKCFAMGDNYCCFYITKKMAQ
ncbi:MAG TPA: V4R domain-containing protein [Methanocellaceae archaeon]